MKWHVIVRVGPDDSYSPALSHNEPRIFVGLARPGDPWSVWNKAAEVIYQKVGTLPSQDALDLLNLAMAVYAADLRIPRSSAADRWTREVVLHLPVVEVDLWDGALSVFLQALSFLTGDIWGIQLRNRQPRPKSAGECKLKSVQEVCLFSGGLDSLVGAIDLLEAGKPVALTGQYGAGMTGSIQEQVLVDLVKRYGPTVVPVRFYVQPAKRVKDPQGKPIRLGEPTMRARSFLFLTLGVALTNALGGDRPLIVAENALISLNVALTHTRLGSLSTRTTHPHFVALYSRLLEAIGMPTAVRFAYRFQTKGQMLGGTKNLALLAALAPLTLSCAHPQASRYGKATPGHCGYCVPCIIRRAALKAAGIDQGHYELDILTSPPDPRTEKGRDLRAFQMAIERLRGAKPQRFLFDVLATGPIPEDDAHEYAELYARGMNEVSDLLELGPIP